MIWFTLWLFTSNYAIPLAEYPGSPGAIACAQSAVGMVEAWDKAKVKPFLYRVACIPTFRVFPMRPAPTESPAIGPSAQSGHVG